MSAAAPAVQLLLLPAHQGAGIGAAQQPAGLLPRWQAIYGDPCVAQHDWQRPRSGDWQIQLEQAVLHSQRPVALLAEGLGCQLVARWAQHSRHARRVLAALLLAPLDVETEQYQHQLPSWQPMAHTRLPFASQLLLPRPMAGAPLQRMQQMAAHWGSSLRWLDEEHGKGQGAQPPAAPLGPLRLALQGLLASAAVALPGQGAHWPTD
ncbi:alpha/beta hydrolase [Vandammella animalimorsus]|uniref:Alpha/beta hydrolase n=1 Tax=Vandammella animalimorsus TaxID=2029117 RepID=A0A3M6R4D0_9BURK|nr:alpha/beta hydrolase [Vandammella animalimorsus]RMX10066.1 alpha/beta hydrolase [Vandammella animalimorsus]